MELDNLNGFGNPYLVKCILLGRQGSGKSTLGKVFEDGVFDPTITTTIGMDFCTKVVPLEKGQKVRVQIWDSAGQEKFRTSIVASYLRDVSIAFIMFDVTSRESWNQIDVWKQLLDDQQYKFPPRLVLVGTKSDIPNHAVSIDEIKQRAKNWKCNYYVLSSKQTNSASMIYRMFYIETEHYHQYLINLHRNKKELPFGVLEKDARKSRIWEASPEKPGWCCTQ